MNDKWVPFDQSEKWTWKAADHIDAADARIAELEQERDGLENALQDAHALIEQLRGEQPAEPTAEGIAEEWQRMKSGEWGKQEQPAELTGCVLEYESLKVFNGPKGWVFCYQTDSGRWHVRFQGFEQQQFSSVSGAIAECRRLAGLEPDEPPEAFAKIFREIWTTMTDKQVRDQWNTTSGQVWRAAKQKGGEA